MKKLLAIIGLLAFTFFALAQGPILRQFGTTNTGPVLTNIIVSLAGGSSQTPWLQAINGNGFDLLAVADQTNTGTIQAAGFVGDGSGLTNLNGTEIRSGTVADARIASTIARDSEVLNATNGLAGALGTAAFSNSVSFLRAGVSVLDGSGVTNLNGSEIRSGTVPTARLGSGTANSTTFLRGDQTWATPAGGAQTPWTSDIDADTFDLFDVGSIENLGSLTNIGAVFIGPFDDPLWPAFILADGSGQFAAGQINWDGAGNAVFNGQVTAGNIIVGGVGNIELNNNGSAIFSGGDFIVGNTGELTNAVWAGTLWRYLQVDEFGAVRAVNSTNCCAVGGGGGTNSGPIALSFSDTNVAINATTPVGCVTNALLPYRLTLTTNAMFQNPTGMLDGQTIEIETLQDATGARSIYWGTNYLGGTDLPMTTAIVSTNANTRDFFKFTYNGVSGKWYLKGVLKGY